MQQIQLSFLEHNFHELNGHLEDIRKQRLSPYDFLFSDMDQHSILLPNNKPHISTIREELESQDSFGKKTDYDDRMSKSNVPLSYSKKSEIHQRESYLDIYHQHFKNREIFKKIQSEMARFIQKRKQRVSLENKSPREISP